MTRFSEAKRRFDEGPGSNRTLPVSPVPVHGKYKSDIIIRNPEGSPLEEYFKWQFVSGLINSGLYPRDYVGVEVYFPKGSAGSSALKLDAAVFDDPAWLDHYNAYWDGGRSPVHLAWLNDHLLAVVEFKRDNKQMDQVFTRQLNTTAEVVS